MIVVRRLVGGGGGVFGLHIDRVHDGVVLPLLVKRKLGAAAKERQKEEGGEAIEVACGDDLVAPGEVFDGGEGECGDVGGGDDGADSVAYSAGGIVGVRLVLIHGGRW